MRRTRDHRRQRDRVVSSGRAPGARRDARGESCGDGGRRQIALPCAAPLSDTSDDELVDGDPDEIETPPYGDLRDEMWLRFRARRVIREFLRSVPRSEPEAAIAFLAPDGQMRLVTRGDLSEAIDEMRPRMRQVIRLGIEEGWPRGKVCAYLHDISMKTFERDQTEGLDVLSEL